MRDATLRTAIYTIAAAIGSDHRPVRSCIEGKPVRSMTRAAVERACIDLGLDFEALQRAASEPSKGAA